MVVAELLLTASEERTRINGNQPVMVAGAFIWEISNYVHRESAMEVLQ